jgi:superoxide dismutase, Fe-Mn family
MKKRDFLKTAGILSAGVVLSPFAACNASKKISEPTAAAPPEPPAPPPTLTFELPALGFATNGLEPFIDTQTMEIHHGKHHAAYVANLNKALNGQPFKGSASTLEEMFAILDQNDTAVRNNGGGHWNHTMFWKWIAPGGSKAMDGALMKAIIGTFGSFENFVKTFSDEAKNRFGSGWAWLCVDMNKQLFIASTPNQDNPLMTNLVEKHGTPILGIDVWEHAYYLKYQNKRTDYITAFMNIVNWDTVGKMYVSATK